MIIDVCKPISEESGQRTIRITMLVSEAREVLVRHDDLLRGIENALARHDARHVGQEGDR